MKANTVEQLISQLQSDPEREQVALELQALQSIYSEENAISIWKPEKDSSPSPPDTVRLEIRTALSPPHESIVFRQLVSLPANYPATAPPQLQLLSRYIGPFQVDSALFGKSLKTYISSGRVEFIPGEVAVFDGIENVRDVIQRWYEDHLSALAAAELLREDERAHTHQSVNDDMHDSVDMAQVPIAEPNRLAENIAVKLPVGVKIYVSDPVVDRKSTFIGRACRITDPSQVPLIISYLLEDKSIARATHPVINAWRCEVDGKLQADNDDDGETAAGSRLAHLLQILDVKNVLVIVTRYYGGVQLHGDRFRHINSVARAALDRGYFLDWPEEDPKRNGRTGAKGKGKA